MTGKSYSRNADAILLLNKITGFYYGIMDSFCLDAKFISLNAGRHDAEKHTALSVWRCKTLDICLVIKR